MADFVMPPDEGADQQKAAAPLAGTDFVMPQDPNPVTLVNARDAAAGNPDEYAKAKKIAERLSMPLPVVQSDLASFDTEQKVADVQARMARDLFYAQQMRDPNFAKLSSGDEGVLGGVKQAVSLLGRTAGQVLIGGPATFGAQIIDLAGAALDIASAVAKPAAPYVSATLGELARVDRQNAEAARKSADYFFGARLDENSTVKGILSGAQSAGQMLMLAPFMTTGKAIASSIEQASKIIAGVMAGGVGAQAYTQAREAGRDTAGAITYSVPHAGFEYMFEVNPVGVLLKNIAGKTALLPLAINLFKAEVLPEQFTTVMQDFNEWMNLHPEQTLKDFLLARPDAAYQTFVATLVGVGLQSGAVRGIQKTVDLAHGTEDRAAKDAAALRVLLDYSNQSALAKRDIPTFTQFVNDAAAQGPVDSVYIDSATFAQAAQQAGVNVAETMPETAAALGEAVATKSDVRIPLGEFAANSTLFQPEIVQHLKTDPNGVTLAETQDAAWVKETQAATEKVLAQTEFTDAIRQSYEVVKGELKAQLDSANRFESETNDAKAGYTAAMYKTLAAKYGITPEQAYVRWPIDIRAINFEGTNVLSQAMGVSDLAPGEVKNLLQKDNWTILTAENPHSVQLTPEANAARMDQLRAFLNSEGIRYTEIKGKYGNEENSLLITGVTPQQALELGKRFDQDSVLTRHGLIYEDGTVNPATGVTEHTTPPADFYSTIPETGVTFTVDVNFDQRIPLSGEQTAFSGLFPNEAAALDYRKEVAFAERVIAGEAKVGDFEFYADYVATVKAEATLLPKGKMLFVGSGPVPLSPILFAREGFTVTGLDISAEAKTLGEQVAAKAGVDLSVEVGDATTFDFSKFDSVVLALEAGANADLKAAIVNRITQTMPIGGKVLLRGSNTGEFVGTPDLPPGMQQTGSITTWGGLGKTIAVEVASRTLMQGSRVKNMTPAISKLLKNLTPYERRKVTDRLAERIIAHLESIPRADEMAAVAFAGKAKRGWYKESARAISEVFGADAPHFAALLAALSPQSSVENNLSNTLRTWQNWDAAGRPRDRATIVSILGKSVEGSGTEKSVLYSWINNAVHALQDIDSLTSRPLSGPKVNSFYLNLLGNVNEVTLDAWMANYALVNQKIFGGGFEEKARAPRDPGKGTAYLAYASRVREAAALLTKLTGEAWTPAEVQETVWSWAKTAYEVANAAGSEKSAHQLVLDDALTDALVQSTPDFANLFHDPKYASILQEAGYGQQLDELAASRRDNTRQPGEDDEPRIAGETTPFDRTTQKRHETRAAKRLDKLAAASFKAGGSATERAAVFAQSALKLPEYGQDVPGSISVVGVHYSKEARSVLLSSKMGTGMKGAEQAREPVQRINFYVNQGTGIHPEAYVGSVAHAVRLHGLYDASADRLNLFKRDESAQGESIRPRPMLSMADMEGMYPGEGKKILERKGVSYYSTSAGVFALNGAGREVGFAVPLGDESQGFDVSVATETQRQGIGGMLFTLFRQKFPGYATGGLTPAGRGMTEKLSEEDNRLNGYEAAVVAHGFDGYYSRDFGNGQGAAVLLGPHAVQAKVVDAKQITELPPPRDATPERLLAEALIAVKGLPSGQMSGPEWISTIWKGAPQIAVNIPESALAALEAHTDLMFRDEVARTFYQVPPEVSNFLADSVIRDRTSSRQKLEDAPLTAMYVGRRSDFPTFEVGQKTTNTGTFGPYETTRAAIFLSKSPAMASDFAEGNGGNVVKVYVKATNPLDLTQGLSEADEAKLFAAGVNIRNIVNVSDKWELFDGEYGKDFVAGVKRAGFDSVWFHENRINPGDAERGASGEETVTLAVFDHNQIVSALSGQMMQGESAPLGQISFGANIRQTPTVLTLLANANLSTFHHELAHFYLEILADVANQPGAPPEMVKDFQIVLKWFGVKDIAAWNAMPLEAKRPYHEMFARGHEMKLFEGKAPSLELSAMYARFSSWIKHVYQQIRALDVVLTDEVRGVYDRMVATNDEILQAETARSFAPLYETKPEGMTDAEWGDYHTLGGEATQEAVDQLQTRSLRDMQYASNAKSAALRRLQARADMLRKGVRAEVTAEVSAEPIYQVMRFLKTGVLEGENAGTYTTHRLDIATLEAMYPENMADRPPILNLANMRGYDGIAPDVVAEMFGRGPNGDALVRELLNTEPMQSKIAGLTDQRMLERYGDLSDPVAMEKAANAAVHNEVRAKFVATELRTLEKAAGDKTTLMAVAREFAATLIARKKIRTLRPAVYNAAANKAAKNASEALRKDDIATAAGEKRNHLVNTYASRFASDALDEVEKSIAYYKRISESKSIDPEYRSQINALLGRFDLHKVSGPEVARRQSLVQWMKAQKEAGMEPAIDPDLENEANRKPYQDMTLEEFRGLYDSIKNIEHLGRLKHKLLVMQNQREFKLAIESLRQSIEYNAKKTLPYEREGTESIIRGITAWHTKLASFMRQFDGWQDNGLMQQTFVHSMNAAGAQEAVMHESATLQLSALLKPLLVNESKMQKIGRNMPTFGKYRGYFGEKMFVDAIGEELSREARIMITLNAGTESNLQRQMDGDHWSLQQVQAIIDTLTKQEMDFVQSIWNFVAQYKPLIGEQHKRLTGVEPIWIPARQVVTKYGVYAGGYIPAKYNGLLSTRSLSMEAAADLIDALKATRGNPKARSSFTEERSREVKNRPLRKDFGVITQHVTEVTHKLAWQEWLIDANRILHAPEIDAAIRTHYGPEVLKSLHEDIKAIAAGNVGPQNAYERGVNYVRTGATIAGLGWRLTTALVQWAGATQSIARLGPRWFGKGLAEFLGDAAHMENTFARIAEKSAVVRMRAPTLQREISEIQDIVEGEGSAFKASLFYLIQKMQFCVDIPTWLGAYHKALATSGIEDPARLEANAIAQADQTVLDTQGSGQVKDLPAALRGGPFQKLWTNFASFFIGTTFQLTRESVGRTDFKSPGGVLMLAADFVLLYSLPAALGTLMKQALGDDDDWDKFVRTLVADQLSYMLGTMVGLRELGSAARSAVGLPGDYGGPAGGRILGEITKLGKQIQQGEADQAFFKALNGAAGVLFHYPAGQINSTADGIAAMAEGKTANPGVLAVGSSKK